MQEITLASVLSLLAGSGGLLALVSAALEYSRQGTQKRVDRFLQIEKKLWGDPNFSEIADMLEEGKKDWSKIDIRDRKEFLGLYEQFILLWNSGIVNSNVAFYMFGYWAIACSENSGFWAHVDVNGKVIEDIPKGSPYWSMFLFFADEMKKIQHRGLHPRLISLRVFPGLHADLQEWLRNS